MYNAKVAGALARQVYISEKLTPPTSLSTIASAYKKIIQSVSSPTWWSHTVPAGDWKKLVVYGTEAIGLFSIGEIVRVLLTRSASAALSATRSTPTARRPTTCLLYTSDAADE